MKREPTLTELITQLTQRQRQVAQLLADGLTRAEIAARLCISQHTVHAHERHIF